jgi:hypothetical protein
VPACETVRWKFSCLLLASALLTACASNPGRPARRDLRLDTETVSRIRHAAALGETASSLAPTATRAVASSLARFVPLLIHLLESEEQVGSFEESLVECARQAERQVNSSSFGNRAPTREECSEEVGVDDCGKPITRAMLLGQQKHVLALQCAHDVINELWPAPFSLEQRYRYYPNARFLETVSRAEEARLIAADCTGELWRTIKPDIVLHADRNLLRSLITLDFKFPCPGTNKPQWTRYGETSAYVGSNQRKIYQDALGGEALIISPQTGITQ